MLYTDPLTHAPRRSITPPAPTMPCPPPLTERLGAYGVTLVPGEEVLAPARAGASTAGWKLTADVDAMREERDAAIGMLAELMAASAGAPVSPTLFDRVEALLRTHTPRDTVPMVAGEGSL